MGDIIKYRLKDFVPFKELFEYSARTNKLIGSRLADRKIDIPKHIQENLVDEEEYVEGLGDLEKFLASNNITTSMTEKKKNIDNKTILKEIITERKARDDYFNQIRKLEQRATFHKVGLYAVNGVYLFLVSLL